MAEEAISDSTIDLIVEHSEMREHEENAKEFNVSVDYYLAEFV